MEKNNIYIQIYDSLEKPMKKRICKVEKGTKSFYELTPQDFEHLVAICERYMTKLLFEKAVAYED